LKFRYLPPIGGFFCPAHTIQVQGPKSGYACPVRDFLWGHKKNFRFEISLFTAYRRLFLSSSHHPGAGAKIRIRLPCKGFPVGAQVEF
jgi:hypothetical protein